MKTTRKTKTADRCGIAMRPATRSHRPLSVLPYEFDQRSARTPMYGHELPDLNHDQWFDGSSPETFAPCVDVAEETTHVRISVELPGVRDEDITVELHDDILVIRGEKRMDEADADGRYYRVERAHGPFERAIPLPSDVGSGGASATLTRGVLTVRLPKMCVAAPPRTLSVRSI